MRKRVSLLAIATVLVAAMAFAAAASAGSPHLKGGVNPNPAFTDNGLTLTATVAYAGLGNFDTQQNVSATANPTSDCVNPSGQHKPPGQNPASANVTGSTTLPKSDIKNGNVTITTTTNGPTTPIAGAPDCPGTNWTENITGMAFTSATITVSQDSNANGTFEPGEVVLTVHCTFSPATSDGIVPASGYTCT
jgi:opacity protein-like surface antigen